MNRRFVSQLVQPLKAACRAQPQQMANFNAPRSVLGMRWMSGTTQTFVDRNEVSDRVLSVLGNFEKVDSNLVKEEAKFVEDLGLDSLDVVEVVMAMEEEFIIEIPDDEAEKLDTPAKVIDYVASHPMAK